MTESNAKFVRTQACLKELVAGEDGDGDGVGAIFL